LVVPFGVEVSNILREQMPQVTLTEDDNAIQALGLDGEHEAFGVGVQTRTARRQPNGQYTSHLEQIADLLCVQRIAIVDQESPAGVG
jgi:hypothetical protein